tara:strand:+ start:2380 stop:3003 length:624 start_codon:yes stop_codon:yes gene_type:complete
MKFKCTQCAKCCTQFNQQDGGVSLFEWEKNKIEQFGATAEPYAVFDINGTLVAYEFIMRKSPCTFLDDKLCSIYENRPLACKLFPLRYFRFLPKEDRFVYELGDSSGHDEEMVELLKQPGQIAALKEYIGEDMLLHALQSQFTASKLIHLLSQLRASSVQSFQGKQVVSLFSYCKKNGILSREWVKEFIQNHNENKDAKLFVEQHNF